MWEQAGLELLAQSVEYATRRTFGVTLLRLAVLHLRRQPWRHSLLILAVALLASLLLMLVTIRGTLVDSLSGAVATADADLLVTNEDAVGNVQASRIDAGNRDRVDALPGVASVSPVGELRMRGDVGQGPVDVSVWGVARDGPGPPGRLVGGRAVQAPTEAVADGADRRRGFEPGAVVALDGVDEQLEIVGIAAGARSGGLATVFTDYEQWRRIVQQRFPDADTIRPNALAVRVESTTDASAVAARIAERTDLEARPPTEAAARLPGIADIERSLALVAALAFGGVMVVVAAFFTVVVAQQQRSLAVLMATGASGLRLAWGVMAEAALITAAGLGVAVPAVVGLGSMTPATFPLAPSGVTMSVLAGAVLVAAMLAALVPARRILRLDVRHVLERGR